jgi:hypothetical protein
MLAVSERHGRATTPRAQRAQPWGWWSSGCVRPKCTRSELIRRPSAPSIAGRSVTAATTATTTATAAAYPMVPTNGIPDASRETRAITTVPPAKTTAPPAVAVARAIDSRTSIPSFSCSLCRVTMKSA